MKVFSLLFFLCILSLSAENVYPQQKELSLDLRNVTISKVISEIEKTSDYVFLITDEAQSELNKRTSIRANKESIRHILESVLKDTDLGYSVVERQVSLYKNTESKASGKPITVTEEITQQKKTITGTIVDAAGEPIIGANIVEVGTTNGTVTDVDGNFSLNVDNNATIRISYIGYLGQDINTAGRTSFNITLLEDTQALEEVVVVGYGFQKKESVVGAITQIDNQSLMRAGTQNVTNAIAGKLSGVLTIQQSGEPGNNDAEIVIRGLSSWNGSQPLVLVDGVERDFSTIDPDVINTISVLKDASATAVFGAKGANGVIIVTTRRGVIGTPKMNFSASYGIERPTMIPDHISSYTTLTMLNIANMNGANFQNLLPQSILNEYNSPSTPLNALRYPNVNWYNEVTRPFAPTLNANFNVSGGTNFIKYFCALGYFNEGSYFNGLKDGYYDLNYRYNRFSYRTNVDFQLAKSAKLSFNLGGDIGIKNSPTPQQASRPLWRQLYQTGPARFPAYFPSWVLEQVPDPDYPNDIGDRLALSYGDYAGNPYTALHSGQFNKDLSSKLFTDLIFDQKLDFITKGLSFGGKVSLSTYYQNNLLTGTQNFPEYELNYDDIGKPGINPWYRAGQGNEYYRMDPLDINVGGLQNNFYSDLYYEFGFNYANTFGKHSVTGLALMNRNQKNRGTEFPFYNEALVGRVTYDYSHKYLFEVNIGYTGSERFAPGNRFGFFPSGALGWVVSEEKFFIDAVPWVNKLKLRYSDGLTGSDAAGSRWLYISGFSEVGNYLMEDLAPNPTAQWEEARKRDLGIEIGLFKNMFNINVDFFDEYRDKMLLSPRSVTMLVGNSFKDLNLGKLKKHGFELEVEFNNRLSSDFNYWVKGIFGFNENRIIYKDDPPYAPYYTKDEGKPLGAQINGVQLTGTGYYTSVDDIHNNPSPIDIDRMNVGDYKFLDYMVDGKITVLDRYPLEGSMYPPITYSLSSGFKYKQFEFNFMFQGNSGKYVNFNQSFEVEFLKENWRVHKSQLDFWTPTNPNTNHSTLHFSPFSGASMLSWAGGGDEVGIQVNIEDRFWRKADYLRLKEVYAAYSLSSKFIHHLGGISNLLIYATGNNLWTLTNLIEGDPESKDLQWGYYPLISTIQLGVKVSF